MTGRHAAGWILAAVLCVPLSTYADAPEECLTLSGNSQVASCADRFAPGSTSPRKRSEAPAPQPSKLQGAAGDLPNFKSVPVAPKVSKVEPRPEPAPAMLAFDRTDFNNPVVLAAIGGTLLVVFALLIWRWGTSLSKTCRWCGARLNQNARTCRRCLRGV